jgi:alkylated DNA repair protein (DNA oxidative demethylase)
VSDRVGYRYEARHPGRHGVAEIPPRVLDIWAAVSGTDRAPQCCLVNFYDADAKMGLHQDRDEADFTMPVVSISLGDDALFRVGGTRVAARRNRSG